MTAKMIRKLVKRRLSMTRCSRGWIEPKMMAIRNKIRETEKLKVRRTKGIRKRVDASRIVRITS